MEEKLVNTSTRTLPWWTWVAPLLFIEAGNQLSLLFKYSDSYSAFYLPTSVAIALIHWWGPARVLPAMLFESTLNSWYYGISNVWLWPAFGLVETIAVFISWYLFTPRAKGKPWLPNIRQTILFLCLGIIIPILFEVSWWEYFYSLEGMFPLRQYWPRFARDFLSELIVNFSFALLVLYFLTPKMNAKGLLLYSTKDIEHEFSLNNKDRIEVVIIFLVLLAFNFIISFENFWFVYALFSLYLAIRYGFAMAILSNAYIFFITYLIPVLVKNLLYHENFTISPTITNTFLGSCLLYLFATITGRVISDLRIAESKLQKQNDELKETNQELDRFVYSVSHDLSAPLKSILGLVNISKLSNNTDEHENYFTKIESSVLKLNTFIKEVLDYSYNKRLVVTIEQIQLKELCTEILENLKFMENFNELKVDFTGLEQPIIQNDKTRLKMILNNLLTNAMKYQKRAPGHKPFIRISSYKTLKSIVISIEDNGEGIRKEVQEKVFNMFFRGHEKSVGSGLGLYIAREAAEKIGGTIVMQSEYGRGSTFSLELDRLN